MNAENVKITSLNYVGRVIEYGEVFCTVRLPSGTLIFAPRNLLKPVK